MTSILDLVLPFFGLIFIGFACGKLTPRPEAGLAWMNFFIVYVALPALFFKIMAATPLEELAHPSFIVATTSATLIAFALAFAIGMLATGGNIREAAIAAVAGSYSNIGYMGPGLTLAALGAGSTVPTALIFCFDSSLFFTLTPLLMALGGTEKVAPLTMAGQVARRVFLHPFILGTMAGVAAAALGVRPPSAIDRLLEFLRAAAAPCALFAMGVTIALRPLERVPREIPWLLIVKFLVHPLLVWLLLGLAGSFDPVWVYTALAMATLPPALNVYVLARQYEAYVERASATVLIGTIVSVATVSGMLYAIGAGLVPADPFP